MAVGEAPTTNRAAAVTRPYNGHRELRGESTVPAHPSTAQCLPPYHATRCCQRAQNRPRRRGGLKGFRFPLGRSGQLGTCEASQPWGSRVVSRGRQIGRIARYDDGLFHRDGRRAASLAVSKHHYPLAQRTTVRRADARFIGRTHTGSHWQQCFLLWRKHPYVASVSSFPVLFTQRGQKHRRRLFKYPTAPQRTTLFFVDDMIPRP
jgi:hypothetical protein